MLQRKMIEAFGAVRDIKNFVLNVNFRAVKSVKGLAVSATKRDTNVKNAF